MDEDEARGLRHRLVWTTALRLAGASLLLLASFLGPFHGTEGQTTPLSWVIAGVYGLILLQAVVLQRGRGSTASALAHLAGDVVIASVVVALTGGADSPFAFCYLLVVIGAGILLPWRGTLVVAGACTLAFAATLGVMQSERLPSLGDFERLPVRRLLLVLATNAVAQFVTAFLVSVLSRQLADAGGRLTRKEQDLRRFENLHLRILDSIPSGILTCDERGQVILMNRTAEMLLRTSSAVLPLPAEQLVPGLDSIQPGAARSELKLETPTGERVLGLAAAQVDATTGMRVVVFQDLTELRRAEEELRRVDRLAALGALSAELAHEIRNPLAAMRGSAQLLAEVADPDQVRLLGIFERESERLGKLVEDFLAFARPRAPVPVRCTLDDLARETIDLARADPACGGTQIELVPAGHVIDADAGQLRQVLLNLIRNAVAATKGSGRIRISFSETGSSTCIHVWDSAGSIPERDLPHIFEPFFTTSSSGTGLGLSTVHSIVRAHGARIQAQSSPRSGTEFVLTFDKPSVELACAS